MIQLRRAALAALVILSCVEQTPDVPSEEDLKAARVNILSQAPAPKLAINANLENKLTILGVDVDTDAAEPNRPFTVTTYFKVNQPITDGWRLFFHVNGTQKSQF